MGDCFFVTQRADTTTLSLTGAMGYSPHARSRPRQAKVTSGQSRAPRSGFSNCLEFFTSVSATGSWNRICRRHLGNRHSLSPIAGENFLGRNGIVVAHSLHACVEPRPNSDAQLRSPALGQFPALSSRTGVIQGRQGGAGVDSGTLQQAVHQHSGNPQPTVHHPVLVLLMTASDDYLPPRLLNGGVGGFVQKPATRKELLRRIREALNHHDPPHLGLGEQSE